MTATISKLGIDKMSRHERLELVGAIWDTIAAEPAESMLSDAQQQELNRRIDDDDAHPENLIPWEQIRAESAARLQR